MTDSDTPQIVYLHGFLSGPGSKKACETAEWLAARGLADHFHCPELGAKPHAIAAQLQQLFESLEGLPVCVVGSSLGGFYATWAAEEFGCRAVLINPAVKPYELLKDYIGPQRNYQTGEIEMVEASFADELRALERRPGKAGHYWLLVQTGDETLDYRDAVDFYAGCKQTVIQGGNHSFSNYAEALPLIWEFARGGSSYADASERDPAGC